MTAISRAITASAGTGKTHRLTSLLLRLLLTHTPPARILATTFTRKAAAEIRDRVLTRLVTAAASPEETSRLSQELKLPLHPGLCLATLRRLLADLDRFSVCTIDSFLLRLARACAADIGLPHGFGIADDGMDALIREQALDSLLDSLPFEHRVRTVSRMHKGLYRSNVTDLLLDVATLIDAHRASPDDAWRQIQPAPPPTREVFEALVAAFASTPVNTRKDGEPDKRWQIAVSTLAHHAHRAGWREFFKHGLISSTLAGAPTYYKSAPRPELARALAPVIEAARAHVLRELALCNAEAREFLNLFDAHYNRAQDEHALRRLIDATHALRAAVAATGLDSLYYRLDAEFDHIMLDEFQDTSIAQYEVLEPLVLEILAQVGVGGVGPRSIVSVGDPKQTLYRWRDAEPAVLDRLAQCGAQLPTERLDKSYRSSPHVIEAVNTVFGTLGANPALARHEHGGPAALAWAELFTPHETTRTEPGFVALQVCDQPPGDEPLAESLCIAAADRIAALTRRAPGVSVGLLTRSRKLIPRLVTLLRERGVAASEDTSSLLAEHPLVAAALSALRAIEHPADTFAYFHASTSPLNQALRWPVPPDASLYPAFDQLRFEITRDGLGRTIASWTDRLRDKLPDEDRAALADLADVAHRFEQGPRSSIDDFLAHVATVRTRSGSAAPVRVMTVHAAKGLEFDAVFLPELEGTLTSRGRTIAYIGRGEEAGPITSVVVLPRKEETLCDPLVRRLADDARKRGIEEELSILYVAMTRARRHLELIIAPRALAKDGAAAFTLTLSGILHGALAPTSARAPSTTLAEFGDPNWPASLSKPPHPPIQPQPPAMLEFKSPAAVPLRRTQPTSLAGAFTLLDDEAVLRGRRFHSWFELIEWADDPPPDIASLLSIARQLGPFDEKLVRREAVRFLNSVTDGELSLALRRDHYLEHRDAAVRVLRERRFTVRTESAAEFLTGQFDRCVIVSNAGLPTFAEVLDFKTDSIPASDAGLHALLNRYRGQLISYREAASILFKLPQSQVRCTLCSTALNRTIALPP